VQTENEKAVRDLMPCPICGCAAQYEYGGEMDSGKRIVKVRCNIGCVEQRIFHCTENDAAISWNHRAALQSQSNTDGWKPIETAPKYKDILFYREDAGVFAGRITTCAEEMTTDELERSDCDEATLWSEDVFSYGFDDTSRCDGDLRPTHWMPMPDYPAMLAAASKAPQQVSNTDGAEQESLQAENARLKDELEELSDLLFNIRTLPVHGYLTKDEFISAFRQEINTVPEVRVSKQRQEIEALRKELQAATAAPKAPQQQEQSGEAVTLDGPELWELLFGIFEGDVPRELTDDKIAAIAEAINHAGFTSPAPPTSTAIAAMVIRKAADIVVDRAHTPYAKNWDEVAETIRNLLPANAEAELEALMMDKRVLDYLEQQGQGFKLSIDWNAAYDGDQRYSLSVNRGGVNDPEAIKVGEGKSLRAIVRRVLDEKGE
jgi:hypothetical protein